MRWKPARNGSNNSRETYHQGKCAKYNEISKLSICVSGRQFAKTDLQPTCSCRLVECSLLKERNEKDTTCMLWCPLMKEYENSHDY